MDAFHPWTKYEIAHLRDEERSLRARDAVHVRALREPCEEADAPRAASWLHRLRRRGAAAEQPAVSARPV